MVDPDPYRPHRLRSRWLYALHAPTLLDALGDSSHGFRWQPPHGLPRRHYPLTFRSQFACPRSIPGVGWTPFPALQTNWLGQLPHGLTPTRPLVPSSIARRLTATTLTLPCPGLTFNCDAPGRTQFWDVANYSAVGLPLPTAPQVARRETIPT